MYTIKTQNGYRTFESFEDFMAQSLAKGKKIKADKEKKAARDKSRQWMKAPRRGEGCSLMASITEEK